MLNKRMISKSLLCFLLLLVFTLYISGAAFAAGEIIGSTTSPVDGATGVSPNIEEITVTFEDGNLLQAKKYEDVALKVNATQDDVNILYSLQERNSLTVLVIEPQESLMENTEYLVVVPQGVVSPDPESLFPDLNANANFTFTTGTASATPDPVTISGVPESVNLKFGETESYDLSSITTVPSDAVLSYSSSDSSAAVVDSGSVVAMGVGTADITVSASKEGYTSASDSFTVTVAAGDFDNISVNPSSVNLEIGDTQDLTVTTVPDGATLAYSSDTSGVATVSTDGEITAVSEGSATITVTASMDNYNDATAYVSVTVSEASTPVEGDANGDGEFNELDIQFVIDIILEREDPTVAADVTGDGIVNIFDLVKIINMLSAE